MLSLGASGRCFFSGASQAYAPRFSHSRSILLYERAELPGPPEQSALTFRRDIVSRRLNACVGETRHECDRFYRPLAKYTGIKKRLLKQYFHGIGNAVIREALMSLEPWNEQIPRPDGS